MTRYRRRRLRAEESAASAAVSLAIGAAAAAATFYVVRLFLSREPLGTPELPAGKASAPDGARGGRELPAPSGPNRRGGGAGGSS